MKNKNISTFNRGERLDCWGGESGCDLHCEIKIVTLDVVRDKRVAVRCCVVVREGRERSKKREEGEKRRECVESEQ